MPPCFAQELSLRAGWLLRVPAHLHSAEVISSPQAPSPSARLAGQQDLHGCSCSPSTLAQSVLWELAHHLPKATESRKRSLPPAASGRGLQESQTPLSSQLWPFELAPLYIHQPRAVFPSAVWAREEERSLALCL